MNPFDLRWLWRAVRGRSLTLALVFLLTVIGLSAPDLIRRGLAPLDLSWWMLWLAPVLVIWVMMRLEPVVVPSERLRRWLALGVVLIALAVVFVLPRLMPEKTEASAERADHVGGAAGLSWERLASAAALGESSLGVVPPVVRSRAGSCSGLSGRVGAMIRRPVPRAGS